MVRNKAKTPESNFRYALMSLPEPLTVRSGCYREAKTGRVRFSADRYIRVSRSVSFETKTDPVVKPWAFQRRSRDSAMPPRRTCSRRYLRGQRLRKANCGQSCPDSPEGGRSATTSIAFSSFPPIATSVCRRRPFLPRPPAWRRITFRPSSPG